ncbi:hypothetical protein T07_1832 [Trichinella nelsoni]|uniref:Uncharacterized protein n=1 Tax=Trichinella nelsoni TaxID=6336 RepID=A0A0V0RCA6_9BILA|nr:hypothetical protein T07_1832 [Trichinella nelsoni]
MPLSLSYFISISMDVKQTVVGYSANSATLLSF